MFKIRADQKTPVNKVLGLLLSGTSSVLLYAPTGSGKTFMASYVLRELKVPAIFIVNKQVLVGQTYETLLAVGLRPAIVHNLLTKTVNGIVMNKDVSKADVVISLVESIENNIEKVEGFEPKIIVIDEAHKATSSTYQDFREKYPNCQLLGLSASPGRHRNKEGEALGDWYDEMVSMLTVRELIENGSLARPVYHAMTEDDHVVNTWMKLTKDSDNKRTIVFTSDTRHSLTVKNAFIENGVVAEMITLGTELEDVKDLVKSQTPNQRNEIFAKFHRGEIDVLISVNALCEGFDEKLAKYCFILRRIGFVGLLHQIKGRVLRYIDGKPEGVIVDFHGNIERYGPIEDYVWEMDGTGEKSCTVVNDGDRVFLSTLKKKKIYVTCSCCSHVYNLSNRISCSQCGTANTIKISARFSDLKEYFVQQVGFDLWSRLENNRFIRKGDEFWSLLEIVARANKSPAMMTKFNEMYFDLFEDGVLIREFRWLSHVIEKVRKVKSRDLIEFDV